MLGITGFIVLSSFMIQLTPMHDRLQSFSERTHMPGITPLYERVAHTRPDALTFGTITQITETGFVFTTDADEILSVIMTSETKRPRNTTFTVGDHVFVHGEHSNDSITALGVRPVSEDFSLPRRGNEHMQGGQLMRPFMDSERMNR
jgi:hypothetical protein